MMATRALLRMPEPLLPAPASWAKVDAPRHPMQVLVRVTLPEDVRTSYCRVYACTMDAYDDAMNCYPDCVRVEVEALRRAAGAEVRS
jgi:hypothetical protein